MNLAFTAAPVWINANPSFKYFDGRIIRYLSNQVPIAYWEYNQNLDEASSMEIALILIHDYLQSRSEPVDLIGHGTGGLLGLLYARQHPEKVKSLTLLGVGCFPATDWQAQYYQMRKLLACSPEAVLGRLVKMMFGHQSRGKVIDLIKILKQDLVTAPTAHSIYKLSYVDAGGISMPMMVCGSENDGIVDRSALQGWTDYLQKKDVLWSSPYGHHFFHYFFPEQTGRNIIKFWKKVEGQSAIISSKSVGLKETCHSSLPFN